MDTAIVLVTLEKSANSFSVVCGSWGDRNPPFEKPCATGWAHVVHVIGSVTSVFRLMCFMKTIVRILGVFKTQLFKQLRNSLSLWDRKVRLILLPSHPFQGLHSRALPWLLPPSHIPKFNKVNEIGLENMEIRFIWLRAISRQHCIYYYYYYLFI
jgi:hypothetical protein